MRFDIRKRGELAQVIALIVSSLIFLSHDTTLRSQFSQKAFSFDSSGSSELRIMRAPRSSLISNSYIFSYATKTSELLSVFYSVYREARRDFGS